MHFPKSACSITWNERPIPTTFLRLYSLLGVTVHKTATKVKSVGKVVIFQLSIINYSSYLCTIFI